MIALERNAEHYLKEILTGLPSDHAKMVEERFSDITETLRKGHIDELQGAEKITLSQCKGLLASVARQMPPNVKDEMLEATAKR